MTLLTHFLPTSEGAGSTFANLAFYTPSLGLGTSPLVEWSFWVCLISMLAIPAAFFYTYRGEQLNKP